MTLYFKSKDNKLDTRETSDTIFEGILLYWVVLWNVKLLDFYVWTDGIENVLSDKV